MAHRAGDMVDVDAVTLAELEAGGVVAAPGSTPGTQPGPVQPSPAKRAGWAGPTSVEV